MNKRELIKLVSEKLGAAGNEVKIAFDIFLHKVAEYADVDSAIRIPEIGIFHLRSKDLSLPDQYNLLFLPLKYNPLEKNRILSFEIEVNKEPELTSGESAFNISIGKPLIPIIGINRRDFNVQSSYIMLQKTFEERTENLLSKAVQITDLKIDPRSIDVDDEIISTVMDDYSSHELSGEAYETIPWDFGMPSDTNEPVEQSNNLSDEINETADDIEIEVPPDKLPDFKNVSTQVEYENITDDEPENSLSDETISLPLSESEPEELFTEVKDLAIPYEQIKEDELENLLNDTISFPIEDAQTEELSKDQVSADLFSEPGGLSEKEIEFSLDEDNLPEENNSENLAEKIDFNAGLDEFRINEEDLGLSEDQPLTDTSETLQEFENSDRYEASEEEDLYQPSTSDLSIPFEPGKDYIRDDSKPDFKIKYGLGFWIILIVFVFLTIGGVYYFIFYNSNGSDKQIVENKTPVEKSIIERNYDIPVTIIPKADSGQSETEIGDKKTDETKQVEKEPQVPPDTKPAGTVQQSSGPAKSQSTDNKNTLIKDYIFSDGSKFTIQISSWRTRSVAESEVKRLTESGYPSYLSEYSSQGGKSWYRVRVGEFQTLSEAENFLSNNVNKLFN